MTDCAYPSVMRPLMDEKGKPVLNSKGEKVQPGIIPSMVLFDEDRSFLKPRYLRRGRLVDAVCNIVATGGTVPRAWWEGHSGEADDDRVEHEECRPYLEGCLKFLAEHEFVVKETQIEVIHKGLRYIGHADWFGYYLKNPECWHDLELKCGAPPPKWINAPRHIEGVTDATTEVTIRRINPLWVAYRRQSALYLMAANSMGYTLRRRAGLHLFDGTYQLVEHDDRSDIAASTIMVQSYHDREQFRR